MPRKQAKGSAESAGSDSSEVEDRVFGVKDAARVVGVSERVIREAVKRGELTPVAGGPKWVVSFLRKDLLAFKPRRQGRPRSLARAAKSAKRPSASAA